MSDYRLMYDNNTNRVHLRKIQGNKKEFKSDQEKLEYLNNIENIKKYELKKGDEDKKKDSENNVIELDASEFFKKFNMSNNTNNTNNHSNNNSDNGMEFISGPRGMPGLIGPQGPPGPKGESISDEKIVEIAKRIISLNNNNQNIKICNKLVYGIKKTGLSDSVNYSHNNNNNLKIKSNSVVNDKQLFDTFYLSPNILEILGNSNINYIHEKKIEVFKNIYDTNDTEYFPLDYLPSGFPINCRSKGENFGKLVIKNFTWNIMQNIKEYEFDELKLIGYVPNGHEYVMNDIELEISVELHSQSTYDLINDRENIFPYRNKFIKLLNPSNTCIYSTKNKKIKIKELNGVYDKNIEIILRNHKYINSYLLCLKVKLTDDSIYFLKGHNKNNEICYGFMPFNQIIVSFDYELY